MSDPAQLTLEERARIRHHMGFMNVQSVHTYALGVPATVEQSFLIEGAMTNVMPEALGLVRQQLAILDEIQCLMVSNLELLTVVKVAEIEINQKMMSALEVRYDYWRQSLGNLFGVIPNPFDKRKLGRSLNVNVNS